EWNKAFLTTTEDYPLDMQPYWKPFIACVIGPKNQECAYYEKESWEPDVYNVNSAASDYKPAYPGVYSVGIGSRCPKYDQELIPENAMDWSHFELELCIPVRKLAEMRS